MNAQATLRELSSMEDGRHLYNLRKGLEHYEVLSDDSLTAAQMAKRLNTSADTVRHYRSALIKAGKLESKTRLSAEITQLAEKYSISRHEASALKAAMGYSDVLSRDDLTCAQMSEETGLAKTTINSYRAVLLKAGLAERKWRPVSDADKDKMIELRREGYSHSRIERTLGMSSQTAGRHTDRQHPNLRAVRSVKKLVKTVYSGARVFPINSRELGAANLELYRDYYATVEPRNLKFHLDIFGSMREAADHIFSPCLDDSEFDDIAAEILEGSRNRTPAAAVRRILNLRRNGYSHSSISKQLGMNVSAVYHYADQIPGSKDLRHLKKLTIINDFGERLVSINRDELEQARMDREKEYFVVVEPYDAEFWIRAFDSKEKACEYAIRKRVDRLFDGTKE